MHLPDSRRVSLNVVSVSSALSLRFSQQQWFEQWFACRKQPCLVFTALFVPSLFAILAGLGPKVSNAVHKQVSGNWPQEASIT